MLTFDQLSCHYQIGSQAVIALNRVSLTIERGTFTVLVGPSGCGKTTLLRLVAGLVSPSSGAMRPTAAGAPPLSIGYVFQEPRLMPWLSVADNVGFGLPYKGRSTEERQRIRAMLVLTGLEGFSAALPHQLSGGMASRVGLARALVTEPDLFLLDEPFAALDALTRRRLQGELVNLWTLRRPTVIFVTHDVEEAVLLADRVCRMQQGDIVDAFEVELPRPRDPTDPAFVALRRRILSGLEAVEI